MMYQKSVVFVVSVLFLSACGESNQSQGRAISKCSEDYKTSFNQFVADRQQVESNFDNAGQLTDDASMSVSNVLDQYQNVADDCKDFLGRFSEVRCFANKDSNQQVVLVDPAPVKRICGDATANSKLDSVKILETKDSEVIANEGLDFLATDSSGT